MRGKLTLHYETDAELCRKLRACLERLEPPPERITIGQLARLVQRPVPTVSMALRRRSCPPFLATRGKRRILSIEPNPALLDWLARNRRGERSDL